MGDVEFEPLHVELEDEAEGFYVVGGKKKDTPGDLTVMLKICFH